MKVAVVGLGIAGLSICARLALAGHDVSGFEQFDLMHENGSSHGDTRIIRLTPGEGETYVKLVQRAAPMWRFWEGLAGRPLVEWTTGLMAGPQGSAFVAACARMSKKPAALLRGDAIHPLTRGMIAMPYEHDVFRQEDAGVIAADATRAFLVRQAPKWGAKLYPRTKIAAPIESTTLTVNGEARTFDRVIVAGGGWARKLLPEFAGKLEVKRRVLGWLKTETPRLMPVICVDNEVGLFGMSAPGGLYKIGLHTIGGNVDADSVRDPDEADAEALSEQARLFLPQHDPKPVRLARCLYTMTPDENFLISPSSVNENILLFSACSGHGFKYAPMFGELAEEWIEGKPSAEFKAFDGRHGAPANGLGGGE